MAEGEEPDSSQAQDLELIAYQLWDPGLDIIVAPLRRDWMTSSPAHFAYRCLPMSMANEYGWLILSDQTIDILWNGSAGTSGLRIRTASEVSKNTPVSHFGSGTVTWRIPYLFRTSPGYDLMVRGPANCCKDGICPLDGIIETDWADAPFTMNWMVTRPDWPIRFEKGEPIAMILPIRHAEIERFRPRLMHLRENPEVEAAHREWVKHRDETLSQLRTRKLSPGSQWERRHYNGISARSEPGAADHRVHVRLRGFQVESGAL